MKTKILRFFVLIAILIFGQNGYAQWQDVGVAPFSSSTAIYTSMAIDKHGFIYIAYQDNSDTFNKITVQKYALGNWTNVGTVKFSLGAAKNICLSIDSASGTPFVAYQDMAVNGYLTVRKFNGTIWDTIGSSGFSNSVADNLSLVVINDTPFVAYTALSGGGGINASKFDGTNWVTLGSVAAIGSQLSLVADHHGILYLGFHDVTNIYLTPGISVKTFNGNSWMYVGNQNFIASNGFNTSMAIDKNDDLYVCFNSATSQYPSLSKYDRSTTVWNSSIAIADAAQYVSLAINPKGAFYIAYQELYSPASVRVMQYDSAVYNGFIETGADFGPSGSNSIALVTDTNGTPYVGYNGYDYTGSLANIGAIVKKYIAQSGIYKQPLSVSACPNTIVSFTSSDSLSSASTKWQVSTNAGASFRDIYGIRDSTYSFTAVDSENGYQYRAIFINDVRHDTSATVTLKVYVSSIDTIITNICNGTGYTIGTHTYSIAGTYLDTILGASVCGVDSFVTLILSASPAITTTQNISICSGGSYTLGPYIYIRSGIYYDTLASASGCDSIVTLTLTVLPVFTDTISQSICQGSTYAFGTRILSVPGMYYDTLSSSLSCDSIITTLHLTVLSDSVSAYLSVQPSATPHLWYAVNQCTGTGLTYLWNWGDSTTSTGDTPSHIYAAPGNYNVCVTVTDSVGCTAAYCDTDVYLFKDQSGQMVYVNVVSQMPNGINTISTDRLNINYYADAVHFSEALKAPADLTLYDLSGRVVMRQSDFSGSVWPISSDIAQGVYIIRAQSGGYTVSKKLVVTR